MSEIRLRRPHKSTLEHVTAWSAFLAASAAAAAAFFSSKQTEIATRTAKQQLRAYVEASLSTDTRQVNFDLTKPLHFEFKVFNRGQTPAYNLTGRGWGKLILYPLDAESDLDIPASVKAPPPVTAFPQSEDSGRIWVTATMDIGAKPLIVENKPTRLILYGTVTYDDTFGDKHFTNFCKTYQISLQKTLVIEFCNLHNNAD